MIITAGRPGGQPCWSEPRTRFSARTLPMAAPDTGTGQVLRGRISPTCRDTLRVRLGGGGGAAPGAQQNTQTPPRGGGAPPAPFPVREGRGGRHGTRLAGRT